MTEFFDISTSPTPVLNNLSPNSGLTTGGTMVTIAGSGFAYGATVMIGGVPATNVEVVNSSSITFRTPAHEAGVVSVTVKNTNGRSTALGGGYTYSLSVETTLLADDFNDNALDQGKWIAGNLFSGPTDLVVQAKEVNQRFEIGFACS